MYTKASHLLKQHEVHDRVALIVLGQLCIQRSAQRIKRQHRRIHRVLIDVLDHEAAE